MKRVVLFLTLVTCGHSATRYMFIQTGNSISIGSVGCGAISTTQPYSNKHLNAGFTALSPLVEDQYSCSSGGLSAYSGGTTYGKAALVTSGGLIYVSLQNSNTGNTPASSPAFWTATTSQESPGSSFVNNITQLSASHTFAGSINGFGAGGIPISALFDPGSCTGGESTGFCGAKRSVLEQVTLATGAGDTLVVLGVALFEGEGDNSSNSTTYYQDNITFWNQYNAMVKAATGQSQDIKVYYPGLSSQESDASGHQMPDGEFAGLGDPSGTVQYVADAQAQLMFDMSDKFRMTGPRYQYTYGDGGYHHDAVSYNALGATMARAAYNDFVGTPGCPTLAPTGVTLIGATVTVSTCSPGALALAIDNTTVPDPYRNSASDTHGAGFQFICNNFGTLTEIAFTGTASVSGTTVTLTLASTPTCTTDMRLLYGYEGQRFAYTPQQGCSPTTTTCNGQTVFASRGTAHGNIRTVADYTDFNGDSIYHWMIAFNVPVNRFSWDQGLPATTLVLEDFGCYQITNAVSSGSNTDLTCITPHGIPTGTSYHAWIQGGSGDWFALNTHLEGVQNGLFVNATDTSMLVNDTRNVVPPTLISMGPEKAWVASKNSNYLFFGPNGALSCNSIGRGCSGTTPTDFNPQSINFDGNLTSPSVWNVLALDSTHLRITLNSSTFSSFSGQTVYFRRALYSVDPSSPTIRAYTGQPWAIYDLATANGLEITLPGCLSTTDPALCAVGFLSPFNTKGYVYGQVGITSYVVSGGVATIMFTTPWVDSGTNSTLQTITASPTGLGSLGYTKNISETGMLLGSLNRPLIISSVITSGGNKVGITASVPGLANGTYTPGTGLFVLTWPNDGYTDSNWIAPAGTAITPTSGWPRFLEHGDSVNWNASTYNRLRYYIRYVGLSRPISLSGGTNWGVFSQNTITFNEIGLPDGTIFGAAHQYHAADYAIHDSKWVKVELNPHWQGSNSSQGSLEASADPWIWAGRSAPSVDEPYGSGKVHYFDGMGRFYMDTSTADANAQPLFGSSQQFKRFETYGARKEPEELISAKTIQYNGTAYEMSLVGPKQNSNAGTLPATYDIYYSTGDMKVNGLSSGTLASAAVPMTSDIAGVCCMYYTSSSMSEAPTMYWAFRPNATVWRTSGNSVSPITIWGQDDYLWNVGDHVTTSAISGNTAANVTNAAITAIIPRQTFYMFAPADVNGWQHGHDNNVLSLVVSGGNTCTINMNGVPSNATVGQPLQVLNGTGAGVADSTGGYTVASTPSSTQFTFSCPGATNGTYLMASSLSGFWIQPILFGQISSLVIDGSHNCTMNMYAAHGLPADTPLYFPDRTSYLKRGFYNIVTVPTSTSFTFACPLDENSSPTTPGTYTTQAVYNRTFGFTSLPGFQVAGTGNGAYTTSTQGYMTSTDDKKNFGQIFWSPADVAGQSVTPTTLGPWTNTQVIASANLTASGFSGTVTWSLLSGTQPTGLGGTCFSGTTGTTCAYSGTLSAAGTFTFTIRATDGTNTVDTPYTVIVNAVPSITTSGALPSVTTGSSYSQSLSTSGGTAPVTCAIFTGTLSGSGLTLNSNCTITGTAASPATYTFTAKPTDANSITGSAGGSTTITVNASTSSAVGVGVGGTVRFGGTIKQ